MDSPNALFLDYLQQLKNAAEEKGNVQGSRIFAKCIKSLRLYPLPLANATEAQILDGFGDKICAELKSLHEKRSTMLNLTPEMTLKCSRDVPDIWWEQCKEFVPEQKKVAKAKRPAARKIQELVEPPPMSQNNKK